MIEERVAALEVRVEAGEKAVDRALLAAERAVDRADTAMTKRLDAGNEVRGAMQDQARQYVTRAEFQWAVGAIVLVLIGLLLKVVLA